MATFTKYALRPENTENSGTGILVAGTASGASATHIHRGPTSTSERDEVWLYASNTSTTPTKLTIEYGGTGAANIIEQTIPGESGLVLVVPGLIVKGNATAVDIKAFAPTTNVINIFGFVNRIA